MKSISVFSLDEMIDLMLQNDCIIVMNHKIAKAPSSDSGLLVQGVTPVVFNNKCRCVAGGCAQAFYKFISRSASISPLKDAHSLDLIKNAGYCSSISTEFVLFTTLFLLQCIAVTVSSYCFLLLPRVDLGIDLIHFLQK